MNPNVNTSQYILLRSLFYFVNPVLKLNHVQNSPWFFKMCSTFKCFLVELDMLGAPLMCSPGGPAMCKSVPEAVKKILYIDRKLHMVQ